MAARKRRKATPAELDAAATITNGDVARARAKWREHAPPALRDLLDAEPLEPKPRPRRSVSSGSSETPPADRSR